MTNDLLPSPTLEHVCTLQVALSPPQDLGDAGGGVKRMIAISGGTVSGPRISGRILAGGADWQTILASGVAELDARYLIETDDGARIEVHNLGVRTGPAEVMTRLAAGDVVDPAEYYMRGAIRLKSGHPDYSWVNRQMFMATGARRPDSVQIDIYAVS